MEHLWVIFVAVYAMLKSSRDCMKKASVKRSPLTEVLFLYTSIGFLFTLPYFSQAITLSPKYIFLIFVKSAVICLGWMFSFFAVSKMPVSLFGIIDLSSVVFTMMMGVFILGESMTWAKAIGALLVITGLFLINVRKTSGVGKTSFYVILCALLCCFLNSISGTMDKFLMKHMSSSQLQFWFMLFLSVLYGCVMVVKKEKVIIKDLKTNIWIPLMSVSLVLGDKLLFEANAFPTSEVTTMTLIKQSAVISTIILGRIIYKEKDTAYKLFCCAIVLSGIFVSVFL